MTLVVVDQNSRSAVSGEPKLIDPGDKEYADRTEEWASAKNAVSARWTRAQAEAGVLARVSRETLTLHAQAIKRHRRRRAASLDEAVDGADYVDFGGLYCTNLLPIPATMTSPACAPCSRRGSLQRRGSAGLPGRSINL